MINSVLHTQEQMVALEREKRDLERRLADVKARLLVAVEQHRQQIARSLTSKDPIEKEMARNVATYYEVPLPDSRK